MSEQNIVTAPTSEYRCEEINDIKIIEKDIDDTVYCHLRYRSTKSVWKMMCQHADNIFKVYGEPKVIAPVSVGLMCDERVYKHECGSLVLCNDYVDGDIVVTLTFPFSHSAVHEFFMWDAVETQTISFLAKIVHTAKVESDVSSIYVSGTLLGNDDN